MGDIDQIIAGGAGASSRGDFSGISDIPEAYWKGKDRRYTQEGRDLFKGGIPMLLDKDGNPTKDVDWAAVSKKVIGHGDIGQGIATENVGIARDQLKLGAKALEQSQGYETGQPPPAIVSPPSVNRSAPATVAPPLNKGGVQAGAGSPQGDQPGSIVGMVSAAGIPDDKAGPVIISLAKAAGIDPNAAVPPGALPRIQGALQAFIARTKGGGAPPQPGGPAVAQAPAAGPPMQGQPGSSAPIQPTPVPTQAIQGQPPPVTAASTGTTAPDIPSRIDQGIAMYAAQMQNMGLPESVRKGAETRLKFLQDQKQTTPEQKNYIQAKLEGFKGTMAEFAVKSEADKTYATEETKSYVKKYDAITKAGAESAVELPKLALAKTIMANPDFYSGPIEGLNLAYKRILATIDPSQANSAAPQEAFRKIISDSVRSQIRSLAESGVGRISIPEVRIIEKAAANQENTPASNRLLVELSTRMHHQTLGLDELARNYNGGRLNPGFDTAARAWVQKNPLVTAAELKDPRVIAPPVFANGDAVRKAGLPKGEPFQTPDGKIKWVP